MLNPRQIFEDNIRPAELILKVYRLLEHDAPERDGERVRALRELVKASAEEGLLVIYNEIFLGLIRERAEVHESSIKRSALLNLLRQAVVMASTALETYLPSLLRQHLPEVIDIRGKDFVPKDNDIKNQFKLLTFDLEEAVRILKQPDPLYIANKMISSLSFNYLSGKRGIHVTGSLLAIDNPWKQIAERLGREEEELKKTFDAAVKRRNDIVHRADRSQDDPAGAVQDIGFAWTRQAADTVKGVCLCLDEVVAERLNELCEQKMVAQQQGTA